MVGSVVLPRRTILFLGPEFGALHFPSDEVLFVAPADCFSAGVVGAAGLVSPDPAEGSAGGGCGCSDAGGGFCVWGLAGGGVACSGLLGSG